MVRVDMYHSLFPALQVERSACSWLRQGERLSGCPPQIINFGESYYKWPYQKAIDSRSLNCFGIGFNVVAVESYHRALFGVLSM